MEPQNFVKLLFKRPVQEWVYGFAGQERLPVRFKPNERYRQTAVYGQAELSKQYQTQDWYSWSRLNNEELWKSTKLPWSTSQKCPTFLKSTTVSKSSFRQQWQQKSHFPSSSAPPPSSSPFSVIPLSIQVQGMPTHCFIVYLQEVRRGEFHLGFQFHLFIHFMTKLITPTTNSYNTHDKAWLHTTISVAHLFLFACPLEDILHTHLHCISCWSFDSLVMVPRCNCARVSSASLSAYLPINPKLPVSTKQ